MNATTADFAATTRWAGILDKPDFPGGVEDISQLSASGFDNGDVPSWSVAQQKFLPVALPATPTPPAPITVLNGFSYWEPGVIASFGLAATIIPVPGANFGSCPMVGAPYNLLGALVSASITNFGFLTVYVWNLTPSSITLAAGTWKVKVIV